MKKKRGLLIASVALVVVIALAALAYGALGKGRAGDLSSVGISGQGQVGGPSSVGTPGQEQSQAKERGQGQTDGSSSADEDAPQLAEYDATVYTESGDPVKLSEIANGRPLVINFWATWCPYCVRELPDFQSIVADYGDRVSFAFVDCADGQRETVEGAKAWLAENGYADLPVYYDTDFAASSAFAARSLPTTAVVSAEGKILGSSAGAIDPAGLRSVLDTLV